MKINVKKRHIGSLYYILSEFITLHEDNEDLHIADLECARDIVKRIEPYFS